MASLAIVNLMTACDKADNEPTIVSDAPKQALLEVMGIRYDKVVARKKAKLRELEREAKHQSMPMHKRLVPVVASTSGATAGSGHPQESYEYRFHLLGMLAFFTLALAFTVSLTLGTDVVAKHSPKDEVLFGRQLIQRTGDKQADGVETLLATKIDVDILLACGLHHVVDGLAT